MYAHLLGGGPESQPFTEIHVYMDPHEVASRQTVPATGTWIVPLHFSPDLLAALMPWDGVTVSTLPPGTAGCLEWQPPSELRDLLRQALPVLPERLVVQAGDGALLTFSVNLREMDLTAVRDFLGLQPAVILTVNLACGEALCQAIRQQESAQRAPLTELRLEVVLSGESLEDLRHKLGLTTPPALSGGTRPAAMRLH